MITLTSFQLKWLERLVLYHINKDNNVQAKLSALQYGFHADVSLETALHEFVCRVEHCLVRKKPALGIFLDIVGAFDNVTFRSSVAALRGLGIRVDRFYTFLYFHVLIEIKTCACMK